MLRGAGPRQPYVSPMVIAVALRWLLEEGVSIRPLRPILEALLSAPSGAPPTVLTDACRRSLSRHIAHPLLRGRALEALLLDPAAELTFRDAIHGRRGAARAGSRPRATGIGGVGARRCALRTGPARSGRARRPRNPTCGCQGLQSLSWCHAPPG